jgi:hypothetical protein
MPVSSRRLRRRHLVRTRASQWAIRTCASQLAILALTAALCLSATSLALALASCSSGGEAPQRGNSGNAGNGTGGSFNTGGVGGDGAGPSTGGTSAAGGSGGLADGARCCGGFGTCVGPDVVDPATMERLGKDLCEAGLVCAPDQFLAGNPTTPCRSVDNAEGRCAPICIPEMALQVEHLPRDTCTESERCAPCYHPADGELSGICNLGGDSPQDPAYLFPRCGNSRGGCVPENLIPPDRVSQVPPDTCEVGRLCAPIEAIKDPNYQFPVCTTTILIYANLEGRCIPKYVGDANPNGSLLNRGNCTNPDDVCAPCDDPTMAPPTPTGVCQ